MYSALAPQLSKQFDAAIRTRGLSYFRRGAVRILRGSADSVTAQVRGSFGYSVVIQWEDGSLTLECSCPYFQSDGPCKHLWATVLAAQERGYLSAIRSVRQVFLSREPEDPDPLAYDLEDSEEEWSDPPQTRTPASRVWPEQPQLVPRQPSWKIHLAGVSESHATSRPGAEWPDKRQIVYVVDASSTAAAGHVALTLCSRDRKKDGTYGRVVPIHLQRGQIASLPLGEDREILSVIAGVGQNYGLAGYADSYGQIPATCVLRQPLAGILVPRIARTGRCFLRSSATSGDPTPLAWDDGAAWQFELELRADGKRQRGRKQDWRMVGILRRAEQTMELAAPALVTRGYLVADGMIAPLDEHASFEWMAHLRKTGGIRAPAEDQDELLTTLLSTPGLPRLTVPDQLRFEDVTVSPQPCLRIRAAGSHYDRTRLTAELYFDYEGRLVGALEKSGGFYDAASRRFVRRDAAAEQAALHLLSEAGVKFREPSYYQSEPGWDLAASKLPQVARVLVDAGWHLDADGKVFRRPGSFQIGVSSGVDWFELHGGVEYGETSAKLPELLEALRRGESMVKLDDGTYGMLPEEWLRRIGMLAGMGTPENGHIRFRRSQAGLLDALLAAQPEAKFDRKFARMRDELRQFKGVHAAPQPDGFVGHLRDYQREGIGWMDFLRRFSFGGCLADDMGVGKTAQVLALLENRRELRENGESPGPSLVVAPRSLIFNWKQEAQRFTPRLRVLDYTGLSRNSEDFSAYHLILTTYGTVRRDAARLKDISFDYVVLDEAQAVKNASTASAKAVRLLSGEHRLALSGTPVENHLGELWSLFEFLNPGMLGGASAFKLTSGGGRGIDEESRQLLANALRPFILRRTKEQVVRELPAKTEQTIYCELKPPQRKLYDELRRHYRDALLKRIETQGLAKSKIMVLEALLRLRQAACHPGLIDVKRSGEASAKLDALQEQLREVLDAGHKALVFSQFTSLLKIVRDRLDNEGVVYEYLDGKTRDRQTCVERFQNDADCKLFLVSLKAGGLGLNLTAAEYVFLLDPWWNPAVEAQAVDRAHRIGQTRPVFAYRLIARDTVEEKVLELQKTKRDLAAAIIGEDNALIRNLRPEDLALLLS
jgi:hypothetical protein